MATSPFFLWSQRAQAFAPFAFWKRKATAGGADPTANLWGSSSVDPYWDYVALLMQFEGTNGSTSISDESNTGRTSTVGGAAYIDFGASSSPYSGRAGKAVFNGTSDYVSFPNSSDFHFGSGDFCIEFWVNTAATSGTILCWGTNSGVNWGCLNIAVGAGSTLSILINPQSGSDANRWTSTSVALNASVWNHIALCRSGNTITLYKNGVSAYSAGWSYAIWQPSDPLYIGCTLTNSSPAGFFNGSLADFRMYKGVPKYTGNFTAPSAPLGLGSTKDSNWANCVLACPFESSLRDMSGKQFSRTGSPSLSTSTKKFGTASLALSGGQALTASSYTDLSLGTADFTIECWVYAASGGDVILSSRTAASNDGILLGISSSGYLRYNIGNGGWIVGATASTNPINYNAWNHLAWVRSGGNAYGFVNGVLAVSATGASSAITALDRVVIGGDPANGNYFSGYIDSLRITKGFARYTANFTPPTSSFPVGKDESVDPFWGSTVLAMKMDSTTDSTSRHTMTNNNSVGFNTSTYKYGGASASFNGSNTYISTPSSSDFSMSTGDYTVDCWVRFASSPSGDIGFFQTETNLSSSNGTLWMGYNSGKAWMGQHGTSNNVSGSWAPIAGVWYHFAICRSKGTGYVFVNGVMLGSGSFNFTLSEAGAVAGKVTALNYLNGFIDDLRVTKGIARYLQNFIPPTREFATKSS